MLSSAGFLSAADTWVPYTAQYTEVTTIRDAHGIIKDAHERYTEYRTIDGSTARYYIVGNSIVKGRIWLACGDAIDLDYGQKTARRVNLPGPRQHLVFHKNWPTLGKATIAGLQVIGWPAHIANGTASMWIDFANDIIAKEESHVKNPSGVSVDHLKLLESIDLSSPVDQSKMRIPQGFTGTSSAAQTCAGDISSR